jgi:ketosteroid isomerase-like protein
MQMNAAHRSEWQEFMAKLESAEEEFARGCPGAFQALWSHEHNVTLCGAFGRVECGWKNVAARLHAVSSRYSDGTRTRKEISGTVSGDFAYLVQTETIRSILAGRPVKQDLRVTMVFRREADGWRIVHRHADSLTESQMP